MPYLKEVENSLGQERQIVMGFTNNHGGELAVESNLGAGVEFTIRLALESKIHSLVTQYTKLNQTAYYDHVQMVFLIL
jgi:hypothetical protein